MGDGRDKVRPKSAFTQTNNGLKYWEKHNIILLNVYVVDGCVCVCVCVCACMCV